MTIFLLFVMVLQSAVDSTSNRPEPYQNLDYELPGLGFHATFDQTSGDIYLFHRADRTLITISETGNVDTVDSISPGYEALDKMDITHSGESIYFWESSIGRVHKYNVSTGETERDDTSHSHRTMFRHAPFLSEDNFIYAIGGYGYWELRNFLIRYEPEFGQWEKMPSNNDEIVIRSRSGLLYKIGNSFYYFVDSSESDDQKYTHAYSFDIDNGMWKKEQLLENVFENFSIINRFGSSKFSHNTTYMVDEENGHLGFLSTIGRNDHLNLVSIGESKIYQLNLTAIGIHDVRAAFFSNRLNQWVILGHDYPMSERMQLKISLFNFDVNHPYINVHKPDESTESDSVLFAAGGALAVGMLGLIIYLFSRKNGAYSESSNFRSGDSTNAPVEIVKDGDDTISVFIHGKRLQISEDSAMKELWTIIAERAESGEPSMLVSNIDQRIYSGQSHPSYNSRNRKKLLNIINTTCGFDLITEERSKIDKRYKVLTVRLDKISLTSD